MPAILYRAKTLVNTGDVRPNRSAACVCTANYLGRNQPTADVRHFDRPTGAEKWHVLVWAH